MKKMITLLIWLWVFTIICSNSGATTVPSDQSLLLLDSDLAPVLAEHALPLYARMGDKILVGASNFQQQSLLNKGITPILLDQSITSDNYYIVYDFPEIYYSTTVETGSLLYLDQESNVALVDLEPVKVEEFALHGAEIRKIMFDPKPYFPRDTGFARPVRRNGSVDAIIDQVSETTLHQHVADLSGENSVQVGGEEYTILTRYSGNDAEIAQATQFTYEFFQNLNYEVDYHYFEGPGDRNVIALKRGTVYPERYFMICGHLDDMPPGDLAPGADDNASGSVAVMVAAELLQPLELESTIIFALWTGEEQGLWGSYYYAREAYLADMDIRSVLNLDMIAWDELNGPIIGLHADQYGVPESMDLAELMAEIIDLHGLQLTPEIISYGTGASDHASFWDYGYTAILAIEDFQDFNDYYHTTDDQLQYFNMPYFTEFVKASVATLLYMCGYAEYSLFGDIDGSGRVDGLDLVIFSVAYGTTEGDTYYDARADLDRSGSIDGQDLQILSDNFGQVL